MRHMSLANPCHCPSCKQRTELYTLESNIMLHVADIVMKPEIKQILVAATKSVSRNLYKNEVMLFSNTLKPTSRAVGCSFIHVTYFS